MVEQIVAIEDQIAEIKREIRMREGVYPKWVQSGRMKQADSDRQIARMRAVLETLEAVKAGREPGLFA